MTGHERPEYPPIHMTNTLPTQKTKSLTVEEALRQAMTYHDAGRLQDAENLYRAILRAQPSHPEANYRLGLIAMRVKQPAGAIPHFEAALESNPNEERFWFSYIEALMQIEQTSHACKALGQAQELGFQGGAWDVLADRLLSIPLTVHAAQDGAKGPSHLEINALVAMFNEKRYTEVEVLAQVLTTHYPLHGFGWKALGVVYKQMGRNSDALVPMQKTTLLSPGDPAGHSNLSVVLRAMGLLEEAEASCRKALDINPSFAEAHNNLGNILAELRRFDEAAVSYQTALQLKPDYSEAHFGLGNILTELRRLDEAAVSYQTALQLKPNYAEAHNCLGYTLKLLGRLEEAERSCVTALQLKPDYLDAQMLLNDIHREQGLLPNYLAPEIFDFVNGRTLQRYFPRETSTFTHIIDIAGTCNLRCPSCPVGNYLDASRPKGFMDIELFRGIVNKIVRENVVEKARVWLFNWGEPMLHPKLSEMISILKQNNIYVMISTNLNVKKKNLEEVIRAEPDAIKISLSGFTQEIYAKTHVKGNIELVKENMILMRHIMNKFNSSTSVWVGHHIYRHNAHESDAVEKLCRELRFKHSPINAFYQPLEKMVNLIEGKQSTIDARLMANFVVHPLDSVNLKRRTIKNDLDCELRFNMTTINYDGSVALCCGVYDSQNMLGVSFLDASHDEIQKLKYQHPFCKKCYEHGLQYSNPE